MLRIEAVRLSGLAQAVASRIHPANAHSPQLAVPGAALPTAVPPLQCQPPAVCFWRVGSSQAAQLHRSLPRQQAHGANQLCLLHPRLCPCHTYKHGGLVGRPRGPGSVQDAAFPSSPGLRTQLMQKPILWIKTSKTTILGSKSTLNSVVPCVAVPCLQAGPHLPCLPHSHPWSWAP